MLALSGKTVYARAGYSVLKVCACVASPVQGAARLSKLVNAPTRKDVTEPWEATEMYCSSCGTALTKQMKYCNRCGAQLITTKDAAGIEAQEKRLDEYLTGLFWITVIGLGLILGGMALITKVLHLSRGVIIGYLILSSLAFIINFGLNLWETLRIIGGIKDAKETGQKARLDTNELEPVKSVIALEPAPSVTENTTRSLDTISKEHIT